MIVMSTMRRLAPQHGLMFLIHEKPFAGINGSGKHNNWSMAHRRRREPPRPGQRSRTPTPSSWRSSWRSSAAVNVHADLLRASIADAGNDHRLGANEAPPAIVSIFLGSQLEDVIEQLEQGAASASKKGGDLELGVDVAAGPAEGRHGPQPDLAVRLHRQQVRVPGGRLVGADLLAADGPQHRRRRLARAARRRPRRARAGRLRGPDDDPVGHRQGQQAGPLRGQQLLRGVARRGGAARPAEQPHDGRRAAGARPRRRRRSSSRGSASCPSASSPSRVEINWERYVKVQNIEANCALDIAPTMILPATARYLGELSQAPSSRGHRRDLRAGRRASRTRSSTRSTALEHAQHEAHEAGSVQAEATAFVDRR